ncbi:MAG TPA: NAD(P)/FAD-dependent oxidoreductase [Candidatus Acidoferrales bacterium]|nr:NAD(P)/FAD-dependent oxidoreductase [Candidatus Acidoferrales bacterium]
MNLAQNYEAIVIGCGPAGSAASAVLAGKGRRVLVLEKEKFPRYHIGESLIPYTYFPLARMGLVERMKASHFTRKYSVQFVSPDGRASHPFYFFKHLQHEAANTWQVLRSEFDQILMDNAREKGAEVMEEVTVRETIEENGYVTGVRAVTKAGEALEFRAPITIDATGRDAFSVTRRGWKVRDPYLNKIAIWTYYKGAMRDAGVDEGATTVAYVPEKGWFWYIPLAGDVVSVGIVAEKDYLYKDSKEPAEIFHREVGSNKWIERHLSIGRQFGPYRVTGEYSYRSRYCAANGLVLIGDAFAFLDPVFSSGVFVALCSGERAADAVDQALKDGDYSAGRFTSYGADLCRGIEAMRRLVYSFYDHAFSFREFINKYPHLAGDITDCLIGNLFMDFDPLFAAVADFARVPPPLSHGLPLLAATA